MRDDCPKTADPAECLDDNVVAAFVEGGVSSAERSRVERLIDQCAVCRKQVSEVMRARSTLGASPALDATAPSGGEGVRTEPKLPEKIGRYEVRGQLGSGGMGVVLRAWDPQLEREVAVKLVRGGSADGALRLVREARAMAKVRHPAVLTVHDAGIVGGEVFVVMELVDGENLSEWYASKPPWRDALERCRVAGTGLAAAHARGLVHRDFKPHNVLCDRDGRVLVADFGLARGSPGVADAASALTSAGAVVGTPAYMAPEQHLGENVGAAADQFALAATMYEGLYGVRPFAGTTLAALISEVLSGQVRPPPTSSDVPRAIASVVMRGLARNAEDRWPSVQAMLDALDAAKGTAPAKRGLPPLASAAAILGGVTAASLVVWAITKEDAPASKAEPAPAPKVAAPVAPPDARPAAPRGPAFDDSQLKGGVTNDQLAHWNILGELDAITARARAWAPDAQLWLIAAGRGIAADGTIDVSKYGNSGVDYKFFSPARTRDAKLGPCSHEFNYDYHGENQFESPQWDCSKTVAVRPPTCDVAAISKRLVADGADPAKGISFHYTGETGAPTWQAWQGNLRKDYPDDCGAPKSSWDVIAHGAEMDAKAKAWQPDAQLSSLVTVGVRPDGTADITAGAFIQYGYITRNRGDNCLGTWWIKDGELSQSENGSTYCDQLKATGWPRCTFAAIWKRAKADGADPAKTAKIEFLYLTPEAAKPTWLFSTKTFSTQYPDDC